MKNKAQIILEYASKISKVHKYFPKDAIISLMRSKGLFNISDGYIQVTLRKNGYTWHRELNSWSK